MTTVAAAALLASALGATDAFHLALRSEVRGIGGGAPGVRLVEPAPFELDPGVAFDFASDDVDLGLAYGPRFFLFAGPEGGYAVRSVGRYDAGTGSVTLHPDDRFRVVVAGSASRGTMELSPLAQLTTTAPEALPGQPAPAPAPLEPAPGIRSGPHSSWSTRGTVDWKASSTLTFTGTGAYHQSGGVDEASRAIFPDVRGPSIAASMAARLDALDTLGLHAGLAQTRLASQATVTIVDLTSRWARQVAADTSAYVAAGVSVRGHDTTTPALPSPLGRVAPEGELGLSKAAPLDRPGLGASARLGLAPYLDPYAVRVRQRASAQLGLDWPVLQRLRITAALSGASVVGGGSVGPSAVAADVTAWSRYTDTEIGLAVRSGFQQGEAQAGDTWQWGVSIEVRWRARGTL